MFAIMIEMIKKSNLVDQDPWLKPYLPAILKRRDFVKKTRQRIVGSQKLVDFAQGFRYFGLHRQGREWVFREWLPNATDVYIIGDFTDWKDDASCRLSQVQDGVWEIKLPSSKLKHQDHYKLHVFWNGGDGERIPAYATRVVQDSQTHIFSAQVWSPKTSYKWKSNFTRDKASSPYIYEVHVGMSTEKSGITTYREFTKNILPRIKKAGYNTIQLMAIQEHPYYGSYGYHVSSLYAPSSRFGTPEDLKELVDNAHKAGLTVIMDLVHSHAVKNETEGLSCQDGSLTQYFHDGYRGSHIAWDSRLYDYGKPQVAHFLLSNCRYWLEEFRFDGYRFDGVTSMIYFDHGLEKTITSYDDYFNNIDLDAIAYLTLANELIHTYCPEALVIAEEVSGMPGIATLYQNDGIGFDYRLSMGIPDLWIKLIKELPDEKWSVSLLLHELSQHRPEEKTISYVESHDQALVGDKTVIFRLADAKMYSSMAIASQDIDIDRAIALHKTIRLMTAGLNNGGYLNFVGNEFGHPEWIDFPRQGNNWSYHYARRQWSLMDDKKLKYHWLGEFDQAMITLLRTHESDLSHAISWTTCDETDQVFSFMRQDLLFVFNINPTKSFENYGLYAPEGEYRILLSTDDSKYGGYDRIDSEMKYVTDGSERPLKLYIPSRMGFVMIRKKKK